MESSYTNPYQGNQQANIAQGAQVKAPSPPTIVEALQAELSGILTQAIDVRDELHQQAERLLGPEPKADEPTSPPVNGAPQFVQVEDLLRRLRNALVGAHDGVRRLRKIG